jgi:hypothetical protein
MVYLLKMVIFHGKLLNNQRVYHLSTKQESLNTAAFVPESWQWIVLGQERPTSVRPANDGYWRVESPKPSLIWELPSLTIINLGINHHWLF